MAYRDLREYVGVLEERGKLHHVTAEVDKDWEIAAVCRRVFLNEEEAAVTDRVARVDNVSTTMAVLVLPIFEGGS